MPIPAYTALRQEANRAQPCSCQCAKTRGCPKQLAKARKKTGTDSSVPDKTVQAVTRDYFINLFNWLGDLPFPLNLLAYAVNCALHTVTVPMLPYIVPNLWSHLQSVWNSADEPSVKAYHALYYLIADLPGTVVCSCLPAELWYYAAIGFFKINNQPDAERALRHYREAGGRDYTVDVARLIREDTGVKARIEEGIAQQGRQSGQLRDWLTQSDFQNDNWLNTLGNVDLVTYTILSQTPQGQSLVRVGIEDPYEWHPDVGRSLPCLHTSMENLKHLGARDYRQVGRANVLLDV